MKFILTILFAVSIISFTKGNTFVNAQDDCVVANLTKNYQNSIYPLDVLVYKTVVEVSNLNFVYSPQSIWLTLGALAEGSGKETQEQLFERLNLPDDKCIRHKYYKTTTSRFFPLNDLSLLHSRTLLIDESVTINSTWHNFVTKNSILNVVSAPIKRDPEHTANVIEKIIGVNFPKLNLNGNSVLLETFDFNGLWTTAFDDAVIERSPFYNLAGEQIGAVDLMRVKFRARMGYIRSLQAKVLELPVGSNGFYRALFFYGLELEGFDSKIREMKDDIIPEMFNSLKESKVPIEVAIPRVQLTGEVEVRTLLEHVGIKSIFIDADATEYVSTPPALPSNFIQRVTVTFDKHGVNPAPLEEEPPFGTPTGLDPRVGKEFIANQPFLVGMFDFETYTPILGIAFSKPTYSL